MNKLKVLQMLCLLCPLDVTDHQCRQTLLFSPTSLAMYNVFHTETIGPHLNNSPFSQPERGLPISDSIPIAIHAPQRPLLVPLPSTSIRYAVLMRTRCGMTTCQARKKIKNCSYLRNRHKVRNLARETNLIPHPLPMTVSFPGGQAQKALGQVGMLRLLLPESLLPDACEGRSPLAGPEAEEEEEALSSPITENTLSHSSTYTCSKWRPSATCF